MLRKNKRVYLDYAATTPTDKHVLQTVQRLQRVVYANPSSIHAEGVAAQTLLEDARVRVARVLQSKSEEVVFTGSGTEANNIAIQGVVRGYTGEGVPHIVTSAIEHSAVLEVCRSLEQEGRATVTYVSVSDNGVVNPEDVERALTPQTVVVSIMYANNEIGTMQPVRKISSRIRSYEKKTGTPIIFHTDASQTPCFFDVSIERLGVDMLTLDGIKIYGPKGVGVLCVKRNITLAPIMFGGGQEKGLRPGTENVPAIVGLAEALELAVVMREKEFARLTTLRDRCIQDILRLNAGAILNGDQEERLPNNINVCFPGRDAEFLVLQLDARGVSVSSTSACHNRSEVSRSYVIDALGKKECATSSLRISLGRETTPRDIARLVSALKVILEKG